MLVPRFAIALAGMASLCAAAPASAQFYMKPVVLTGEKTLGDEPGMVGPALPGASREELRAALVWNLRAALNVAALQCQFEPTLLTLGNYNALLTDHKVELAESLVTLEKYFTKVYKVKKTATTEFDKFGTRVYAGFSTVSGQLSFCQTSASIGQDALFTKRGELGDLAARRMREMRNSLAAWGEQYRRNTPYQIPAPGRIPAFSDPKCWRKGEYQAKRCGALVAAR